MGAEDTPTPHARTMGSLEGPGLNPMAANAAERMPMAADGRRPFPEAPPETASDGARPRRGRTIGSQMGKAGLPHARAPRGSGRPCRPSVPGAEIEDLATLGFVDRHENVTLVGSPGVGKTHLVCLIASGLRV